MRRNRDPQTTAILLIVALIILCVLTGCSAIPDICQTGVPTNKNCFTASGAAGQGWGFGPINLYSSKF